jgi:SAM-dependent methyltransferase
MDKASSLSASGLYDYANLDGSGEAALAAVRMEARAHEPASAMMFTALVAPLIDQFAAPRVLELGAGTGALGRRIVAHHPGARVTLVDRSAGMLEHGRKLVMPGEGGERLTFTQLDLTTAELPAGRFDLVVSSVMIPYLDDAAILALCRRSAACLTAGGTLAFLEQDLESGSLYPASHHVQERLFARIGREPGAYHGLGIRSALRLTGLTMCTPQRYLWSTSVYGAYLRDLIERSARAATESGTLRADEIERLQSDLVNADVLGDFHYGIAYHLLSASAP